MFVKVDWHPLRITEKDAKAARAAEDGGKKYNTATITNGNAGSNGSPAFNANHIIQYPKQPKRDDGKWIAIASLLGSLLGRFTSSSLISKAKDAENAWRSINDRMRDSAYHLLDSKAPKEYDLATVADDWLRDEADFNKTRRDDENAYAEKLEPCNDELHDLLCQLARCGYQPDYMGISMRTIADAESKLAEKRREIRRNVNRYGLAQCCEQETRLAMSTSAEIVGTIGRLREAERVKAFDTNMKLRFDASNTFEQHRASRLQLASAYDDKAINIQTNRYNAHINNYDKFFRLGLEVLASVGKNYGWLAESLRKTADKDSGGISSLMVLLGLLATHFMDKCTDEDGCTKGGGQKAAPIVEAKPV